MNKEEMYGSPLVYVDGSIRSILRIPTFKNVSYRSEGVKLSNHKYIIANGLPATTPLSGRLQSSSFVDMSYSQVKPVAPFTGIGSGSTKLTTLSGTPDDPFSIIGAISVPSAPLGEASTQFYKAVGDAITEFQSGVFLGELRETIKMVSRPGNALIQAFTTYGRGASAIARRYGSNRKALQQAIAGSYLEAQYGWQPLLSDLKDGIKVCQDFNKVKATAKRVIGSATSEVSKSSPWTLIYSEPPIERSVSGSCKVSVRYIGEVSLLSVSKLEPGSELGLSLRDFVPTIYNLLPWSFLVDYFTNLGDFLTAMCYRDVKVNWCNLTVHTTTSAELTTRLHAPSVASNVAAYASGTAKYSATAQANGRHQRTTVDFSRDNVPTPKAPGLAFRAPSGRQLLNISALIAAGNSRPTGLH